MTSLLVGVKLLRPLANLKCRVQPSPWSSHHQHVGFKGKIGGPFSLTRAVVIRMASTKTQPATPIVGERSKPKTHLGKDAQEGSVHKTPPSWHSIETSKLSRKEKRERAEAKKAERAAKRAARKPIPVEPVPTKLQIMLAKKQERAAKKAAQMAAEEATRNKGKKTAIPGAKMVHETLHVTTERVESHSEIQAHRAAHDAQACKSTLCGMEDSPEASPPKPDEKLTLDFGTKEATGVDQVNSQREDLEQKEMLRAMKAAKAARRAVRKEQVKEQQKKAAAARALKRELKSKRRAERAAKKQAATSEAAEQDLCPVLEEQRWIEAEDGGQGQNTEHDSSEWR